MIRTSTLCRFARSACFLALGLLACSSNPPLPFSGTQSDAALSPAPNTPSPGPGTAGSSGLPSTPGNSGSTNTGSGGRPAGQGGQAGNNAGTGGTIGQGGAASATGGRGGSIAVDASVPPGTIRPPVGGNDAGLPQAATSCSADDECIATAFGSPVTTESDCYCLGCSTKILNKKTAELHQQQHKKICADFLKKVLCPAIACPLLVTLASCNKGMCVNATNAPAATCSLQGTGCAGNAVKCGGACCKQGESCDDATKTCRCAGGPACKGEAICGGPGAFVCGSFCCGPGTDRVCPR